jgi:hypothetical protein
MRLAAALAALLVAPHASAVEVAGVKVEETASLDGAQLVLNGAGLRTRFFFKVYVGALYVAQRSGDPVALVAADAPRLVRLHMLRELDREAILKAFREGIEKNSPSTAAAALRKLAQVEKAIPAELKPGQVVTVAYRPGVGTALGIEGGASASVEGKDFADAVLRIWLGDEPVDADLKAAMLGKQ